MFAVWAGRDETR